MQFTDEQRTIIEHISGPNKHLLVTARAGAAKTTTLVAAAEALPSTASGLVLAFNKKIADEMKLRLPPNFRAMTLNGCGFDAWRRYIGRSTKVLADKNFFILKEFIDQLSAEDREAAWNSMSDLKRAISSAKTYGYIPQPLSSTYRPLMSHDEFYNEVLFIETSQLERELIDATLTESWKQTCAGVLDFDDMVLAPAVAPVSFPHYDFILVDEAQDLASINHVMLKKLVRGPTRLVAVGDPCQAIYGFRGADSASMTSLKNLFDAPNLYLTTSFRCSKAVCINAQWRAPDMRYPEWAVEGSVQHLTIWSVADIPDEAAILCRNNAPLFSMAIQLLRAGRHPELKGRDMLASVLTKMKKLGRADTKREALLPKIEKLREQLRKKQRDQRLADDTIECILVFVNETDTLGAAMAFAEAIAMREGRIKLYTGHGAKGLEFDTVLFLDQHLLDIKRGQDANVKYVIETRAKRDLIYVTSEGFQRDTETEASNAA